MRLNPNLITLSLKQSALNNQADSDLARRVTAFLFTRHRPGLRLLEIEARGGVVTLRGRVSTFYEKQLSAQLVRRVAGVLRIVDDVVVRFSPSDRRQEAGRSKWHSAVID